MLSGRLLGVALLPIVVACAAPRPETKPAGAWLELAGEFNVPALTLFAPLRSARFGGVSGLAFDPRPGSTGGDLLGISDDRDAARLFIFRVEGVGPSFTVHLRAYLPLPRGAGVPAGSDAEGIAMTRAGRIFVASEGVQTREPRVPPSITIYDRRADYLGQLPVPERFSPPERGPATRGVRSNAGFESLALSPDERHLFTATELPLVQDGEPPSVERGALVRILEYQAADDSFRPVREYAYPLDPLARAPFVPAFAINGAVELLSLGPRDLLVMERCFAREGGGTGRALTRIRIYRASLAAATEVSGVESLRRARGLRPARKTLLLDLADVKGLSPELAGLDNFEGMAFGPPLPDGGRTLLLVSDDNFSPLQRTSFLLFRILRPLQ
jgi:hypothetical protein